VLIAGALGTGGDIVVARLRTDGELDPAFGPGGTDGDGRRIYSELGITSAGALVVEPDGNIVIAGVEKDGYGLSAARIGSDGAVLTPAFDRDTEFGGDVTDAVLVPGGKIVVVGSRGRTGSTDNDILLARFNHNGTIDRTLDGTGRLQIGPADRSDTPLDALVQPDGAIVLAVDSRTPTRRTLLIRLGEDGKPDADFGIGGTVIPDFLGEDLPGGVERQPDGKLLLTGTLFSEYDMLVARFTPAGDPDPSFGDDGKAVVPFADPAGVLATSLAPDGKLVAAGINAVDDLTTLRPALIRMFTAPPPVTQDPGTGDPGTGDPGPGPGTGGDPVPVPTCAGLPATIVGSARGETLRGTSGRDVIVAGGGRDTVRARGGRDLVCGGGGRDVLTGGAGGDRIAGGRGHDRCAGGAGRDRLSSCEAPVRR
jgi:uncharacterized delta-60 repeat protein